MAETNNILTDDLIGKEWNLEDWNEKLWNLESGLCILAIIFYAHIPMHSYIT